jgi:hypothetical protein
MPIDSYVVSLSNDALGFYSLGLLKRHLHYIYQGIQMAEFGKYPKEVSEHLQFQERDG